MPRLPTNDELTPESADARLMRLEWEATALDRRLTDRLDQGAETFSAIKRQLGEIEQRFAPKPTDKYKLVAMTFGIVVAFLTWVWHAARYPDRSEYDALRSRIEIVNDRLVDQTRVLRDNFREEQSTQRLIANDLEALEERLRRIEDSRTGRKR